MIIGLASQSRDSVDGIFSKSRECSSIHVIDEREELKNTITSKSSLALSNLQLTKVRENSRDNHAIKSFFNAT